MQVEQYLVLKPVSFKAGRIEMELHEKGCIFLSYNKKKRCRKSIRKWKISNCCIGMYTILKLENK